MDVEALSKHPILIISGVLTTLGTFIGGIVGAVIFIDRQVAVINKRAIPPGAVVAFDLLDGCPSGWSRFDSAIGRAVVGVGIGKVIGSTATPSKEKKKAQITPTTTYTIPMAYEYRFGVISMGVPEYVALYYCKKSNE